MFRSIQSKIDKRVEQLKNKTHQQSSLDGVIRKFLIAEFGPVGETLDFSAAHDQRKLFLRVENKTAANEIVVRSKNLLEALKAHGVRLETIIIT